MGLWSRVEGFRRDALVEAIDRRAVVRATLMRGTIHLVSRGDYARFRPAVQPALSASMQAVLKDRMRGIDIESLVDSARGVFAAGPCTFAVLRERLARRFPDVDERAMGYTVRMHLPLVQVPVAGQAWAYPGTADFALADAWLGEPVSTSGPAHQLVLRYFAAFGPATLKDLQTWSYVPGLEPVVEELRPKLKLFRDERGRDLYDLPKAPRPPEDAAAPVRFLPEYDNLLLAYADRTRVVADAHRKAMATKNLFQPATLLVDGTVAATWSVTRAGAKATLAVAPFLTLGREVRSGIADEGERLLAFLEPDAKTADVRFVPRPR